MKDKFKEIISSSKYRSQLAVCIVLFIAICVVGGKLGFEIFRAQSYVNSLYEGSKQIDSDDKKNDFNNMTDDLPSPTPTQDNDTNENEKNSESADATFTPLPTVEVPENLFE